VDDREARERVAAIEGLLTEIDSLDEPARSLATNTVQAVVELYGEGLARIADSVADAGAGEVQERLVGDEVVSHLLLLHDLHPVDVETRVRVALQEVGPYLGSHGGGVELLGVSDGVARLRLEGSCEGCPSSAMTLQLAIEEAIHKAAPDVERVEAEGVAEPKPTQGLIQLGSFKANGGAGPSQAAAGWAVAGSLPQLAGGGTLATTVAGERVLFLSLDATYYAYRDRCAGCLGPLEEATLTGAELECAGCGRRFDARRAGRCLDAPDLYLEPIPLLVTDGGLVKVALGTAVGA
jgi:Fe-S cluster biogenesis protein NfuA/nitrite reductase/ring-hydroxylating ferredoxin subunit